LKLRRFATAAVRSTVKRVWYFGWKRFCPICNQSFRLFLPYGLSNRPDVQCPVCGSAERHRLAWVVLQRCTNLFDASEKQVLHFAPEACLSGKLRKTAGLHYVTADLLDPAVDVTADVTNLPWHDCSFDSIICLNVLQHVSDSSHAFRELYRISRPGGWALFVVPLRDGPTIEYGIDGFIPGQPTHGFPSDNSRRVFGLDFADHAQQAGFSVQTLYGSQLLNPAALARARILQSTVPVFLCRRPN
jgi:SAM-dependent methyltransferase